MLFTPYREAKGQNHNDNLRNFQRPGRFSQSTNLSQSYGNMTPTHQAARAIAVIA